MADQFPVPVPAGLEWFASFISERMGRLENMITGLRQEIKTDFVMKHELETVREDVDATHRKYRDLDSRLRGMELQFATNASGDKVRWEVIAKVIGALGALGLAIVLTWLGLK